MSDKDSNSGISLEKQVLQQINECFADAISKRLQSDYHGPFGKIIERAVAAKEAELFQFVTDAFSELTSGSIKEQIKQAAAHKIAKVLVSKMEGEIERRANDFRADPTTRARITLAIEAALFPTPSK